MNFFMSRDSGPLVSVLIPSRGRLAGLLQAIDSLWSLAEDKSLVEFLVKVDDDDHETIDGMASLGQRTAGALKLYTQVSPRGRGYRDLHNWINDLARRATGDWLFVFNDDSRMTTQNWDQYLLRVIFPRPWFGTWDICLINAHTVNSDALQFPLLRRKAFEVMGHFSQSCHIDTWVNQIFGFLRMGWPYPNLKIDHVKSTPQGDWSKDSRHDYSIRDDSEVSIHSLDAKRRAMTDVDVIIDYLRDLDKATDWKDSPTCPGWWYWDKGGEGAEGNSILVDGNMKPFGLSSERKDGNMDVLFETKVDRGRCCLVSRA